jgi:hypothetical protein
LTWIRPKCGDITGIPANSAFESAATRLSASEFVTIRQRYWQELCGYVNQLHTKLPRAHAIGALTAVTSATTSSEQKYFDEVITLSDVDIVKAIGGEAGSSATLSLTGLLQDGAAIGPFMTPVILSYIFVYLCIQ